MLEVGEMEEVLEAQEVWKKCKRCTRCKRGSAREDMRKRRGGVVRKRRRNVQQ
jgi:hypothetical protein